MMHWISVSDCIPQSIATNIAHSAGVLYPSPFDFPKSAGFDTQSHRVLVQLKYIGGTEHTVSECFDDGKIRVEFGKYSHRLYSLCVTEDADEFSLTSLPLEKLRQAFRTILDRKISEDELSKIRLAVSAIESAGSALSLPCSHLGKT